MNSEARVWSSLIFFRSFSVCVQHSDRLQKPTFPKGPCTRKQDPRFSHCGKLISHREHEDLSVLVEFMSLKGDQRMPRILQPHCTSIRKYPYIYGVYITKRRLCHVYGVAEDVA